MPMSKRNRTVTLSKTKKKGRKHKEAVANAIKQALEDYGSSYVVHAPEHEESEVQGETQIHQQIALGRSIADEVKSPAFVNFLRVFQEYDFARTGNVATEKVELKEGPLEQFTHAMEPYLRKQGLPVRLKKGLSYADSVYVLTIRKLKEKK